MNINITNKDAEIYIKIDQRKPEEILYFSLLPNKLIYSKKKGMDEIILIKDIDDFIVYGRKDNSRYITVQDKKSLAKKKREDIRSMDKLMNGD